MFVFSNLAMSLDGKIATKRRGFLPLGTAEDWRNMIELRRRSQAIIIGASTLRSYSKPCLVPRLSNQPINILVSSKLEKISPRWEFFTSPLSQKIIFVTSPPTPKTLQIFKKLGEIILLKPSPRKSLGKQIIDVLQKRGIRSLLIEGGGGIMWNFAQDNLIDEYHVTVTPRILGGSNSPTLVDGAGFSPEQSLNIKLRQCRILKDELYLIYTRAETRGIPQRNR